jgi:pimeloyl-ACP methyl ester carboxylesterase
MSSRAVQYKGNLLVYWIEGCGPKKIALFHGFGQNHQSFSIWVDRLRNECTLYLFDLFFHGQSQWNSQKALKKSDWQEILSIFFHQESITDFEVVGFSMGGKFALATTELFPARVKKLTLLAPDGIQTSFWYSLATYPIATRYFFKSMILHPNRLRILARFLRALHLVDNGLLRFAEHQMDTEEKRRRVYYSWVYFRHFKFNRNALARIINQKNIHFTMIIGRYDKVITAANMQRFLSTLKQKEFVLIEAGHNDLIAKSLAQLSGTKM